MGRIADLEVLEALHFVAAEAAVGLDHLESQVKVAATVELILVGVAFQAARGDVLLLEHGVLLMVELVPVVLRLPLLLLFFILGRMSGVDEVGGVTVPVVTRSAPEGVIRMRTGAADEEIETRVTGVDRAPVLRRLQLIALQARINLVNVDVTCLAAVDSRDRAEVQVLVQFLQDDLLDLVGGREKVEERHVAHEAAPVFFHRSYQVLRPRHLGTDGIQPLGNRGQ